jgi:hypothetical protein
MPVGKKTSEGFMHFIALVKGFYIQALGGSEVA